MTTDELINALERMESETGSLADSLCCLGCGHEHNCGMYGCAVIREAIDRISIAEWIPATLELPPDDREIFVLTRNKNGSRNVDKGYWSLDQQRFVHRGTAEVTHWMPIPDYPAERRVRTMTKIILVVFVIVATLTECIVMRKSREYDAADNIAGLERCVKVMVVLGLVGLAAAVAFVAM